MSKTKDKLRRGEPALGGWMLIGHPSVAEIMASEGFDWICVDLEHSTTGEAGFFQMALATCSTKYKEIRGCQKGSGRQQSPCLKCITRHSWTPRQ